MLIPKQVKYRKLQKGRRRGKGVAQRGGKLNFGSFGLKALGSAWLTSRQIEASRRVLAHFTNKGGKVWIRIFPDKSRTKKGAEVGMGGGKGSVDHYVANIRPGAMIFEIDGVEGSIAREAFRRAGHKLPMRTKFVKKVL